MITCHRCGQLSEPGSAQCAHCKQRFSGELQASSLKAAQPLSSPTMLSNTASTPSAPAVVSSTPAAPAVAPTAAPTAAPPAARARGYTQTQTLQAVKPPAHYVIDEASSVDGGYPSAPAAPVLSREQIEHARNEQIQAQLQHAQAQYVQMQQAQQQQAQLQHAQLQAAQEQAFGERTLPAEPHGFPAAMPFVAPVESTEAPTPGPSAGIHGAGGAYAGGTAPRLVEPATPAQMHRIPKKLLVIAGARLLALSPSDGQVLWWSQLAHQGQIIYALQMHQTLLFALTSSGVVFCMDHASGRTRWTMAITPGRDSKLQIEQDMIYIVHGDRLDCVNLHGWRLWSQQLGHQPGDPVKMRMSHKD